MFDSAAPNASNTAFAPVPGPDPEIDPGVACQLPADAYCQLVHTLRLTLPPPLTDSPEDLLRRDHAAIARIAALVPANAAEADVAAQSVAASEHWKDCLRLAQAPHTTPEWATKCRAQALAMMRQANSALRLLLRMQEARRKLEASAAADAAAWIEHCAIRLMTEALAGTPAAPPAPAVPEPTAPPAPAAAWPDPPAPDLIAAAERYAARYPERAAAIRRTGRVPHDVVYFDPPEAELARTLIRARTPALVALDLDRVPEARAA